MRGRSAVSLALGIASPALVLCTRNAGGTAGNPATALLQPHGFNLKILNSATTGDDDAADGDARIESKREAVRLAIKARQRVDVESMFGQAFIFNQGAFARGGALRRDANGEDLGKSSNERKTVHRNPAAHTTILTNAASWTAVVGAALGWGLARQDDAERQVRTALLGAVVVTTSLQVASNILQVACRRGQGKGFTEDRYLHPEPTRLRRFRWSYLSICSVCLMAEYFSVPYIWPFFLQDRGLTHGKIFQLHVVMMLSSLGTGLFSGGLIDRYGRKNGCLLWAVLSISHYILIRSKVYNVIVLSRVLAGAGATLMATTFESWMVTEHHRRGFSSAFLPGTFRLASWTAGLSLIAVGFASQGVAAGAGHVAVYNVAIVLSAVAGLLIWQFWPENYGDRISSASQHTAQAFGRIVGDGRLLMMGIVQVFFEGALLAWINVWQPRLQGKNEALAAGTVMSTLLISSCGGTALFKLLTEGLPRQFALSPETCMLLATGVGTAALGVSAMDWSFAKMLGLFLLYETCLGIYYPAMATCRSKYIADDLRTTVMGIFRVPMYLVGILVIQYCVMTPSMPEADAVAHKMSTAFLVSAALAGVGTLAQVLLVQRNRELEHFRVAGLGAGGVSRAAGISGAQANGNAGTGSSR